MNIKKPLQMIIVLGLVCFFSGTSLALVYNYTAPLIKANRDKALKEAIFKVVPGGVRFEVKKKGGETLFEVYNNGGALLGYAFIAEGSGYQGEIKMISGIKRDLSALFGIEILESVETPGLGGEIISGKFKGQFKNIIFRPKIECNKRAEGKRNEIQAITGATISSRSVTNILNKKIAKIIEILKQ